MFLEVQFNKRSQLTTISTMDIKSRSLTNEDLGKKIMCFCISVVFLCSVFLNAVFCMNQGGHDLKLDSTRVHHKGKTYTPIVFLVKLYCQIIRKQIPPLHYVTISNFKFSSFQIQRNLLILLDVQTHVLKQQHQPLLIVYLILMIKMSGNNVSFKNFLLSAHFNVLG